MNKFFDILAAQQIGKVLIMGVLLTGFYWWALYDDGSSIDSQIATVNQQLIEEEKKKTETDAALKQVQEMKEKVGQLSLKYQEISRLLPRELGSSDIVKAIDDFARSAGVSVKSKKPRDSTPQPGENVEKVVEEVSMDVVLEGTYGELAQFTHLVSSAERMARVQNITIAEQSGVRKLSFEGQVVGYRLAPEKKSDTTETPQ